MRVANELHKQRRPTFKNTTVRDINFFPSPFMCPGKQSTLYNSAAKSPELRCVFEFVWRRWMECQTVTCSPKKLSIFIGIDGGMVKCGHWEVTLISSIVNLATAHHHSMHWSRSVINRHGNSDSLYSISLVAFSIVTRKQTHLQKNASDKSCSLEYLLQLLSSWKFS